MSSLSLASSLTEQVGKLTEKNYSFFAYNKVKIHYLTGKNRFKKISFDELIDPKQFTEEKMEIDIKGIARDIIYFKKEKYNIIMRKNKKYYKLKGSKFIPFNIPKTKEEFLK